MTNAFPGGRVEVSSQSVGRFSLAFHQPGLLRPLTGAELSDGTLRYLLWVAALLTPRPPELLVLNEPETSLHPSLLPAVAELIVAAAASSQIVVVTHAVDLVQALTAAPSAQAVELTKEFGETRVADRGPLEEPSWHWPKR